MSGLACWPPATEAVTAGQPAHMWLSHSALPKQTPHIKNQKSRKLPTLIWLNQTFNKVEIQKNRYYFSESPVLLLIRKCSVKYLIVKVCTVTTHWMFSHIEGDSQILNSISVPLSYRILNLALSYAWILWFEVIARQRWGLGESWGSPLSSF